MEMSLRPETFLRADSRGTSCVAELGEYTIHCLIPNSFHLAAAAAQGEVERARFELIAACVQSATRGDESTDLSDIPDDVIHGLGEHLAELDPLADLRLTLHCGACEHRWLAVLDLVSFLWKALENRVQKFLMEVHLLATSYGWSEAEILAMRPARRRAYVELCTG